MAADRVALALTKRYREPPGPVRRPRLRLYDPDEEIDDDSPMALALTRARQIVEGAARLPAAVRDPSVARDRLFAS